jgi:hypothetical protein
MNTDAVNGNIRERIGACWRVRCAALCCVACQVANDAQQAAGAA